MALIKCKECDKEISTTAKFCPNCGAPASQSIGMTQSSKVSKIIVGWILILIGLVLIIFLYTKDIPYLTDYALQKEYSENQSQLITYSGIMIAVGLSVIVYASKSKIK